LDIESYSQNQGWQLLQKLRAIITKWTYNYCC